MRTSGAVLAGALMLSGCSGTSDDPGARSAADGPCGLDFRSQPAEVMSEPQLLEVSEEDANLVLDLSSVTRKPLRVTVRLNGEVALDVRTPALPVQCDLAPIYSHGFRLAGDTARVTVATDQGKRSSTTVRLTGRTRWVVIQPQDGFPLELDVFDEEPAWG